MKKIYLLFAFLLLLPLCSRAQSAIGQLEHMSGGSISRSGASSWSGSSGWSSVGSIVGGLLGNMLTSVLSENSDSGDPSAEAPAAPAAPAAAPVMNLSKKAPDTIIAAPCESTIEGCGVYSRYPIPEEEGWSLEMGFSNESETSRDAIIVYQEKTGPQGEIRTKIMRTGLPGGRKNESLGLPGAMGSYGGSNDGTTTRYKILYVDYQ
jgi:hypothetical protein